MSMTLQNAFFSIATRLADKINQAKDHPFAPFPHHSRIHPLRSFQIPSGTCYVKRDDELGFGISGSKLRKYLSLLPALLKEQPDEAVLIGSAFSNHLFSLSQLLKENGVEPVLFLEGNRKYALRGNFLYSNLITGGKNIHWMAADQWLTVDQIAAEYVQRRKQAGKKAIVVPKGGSCAAALLGSMTLALDILQNQIDSGVHFDHVFIDSGSGLTTSALLLAFTYLEKPPYVHVIQVAGSPEQLHRTLSARKQDLEHLFQESIPSPSQFKLYRPSNAAPFGATNATVFKTIAEIAYQEGFLTDPIYTAKLFYEGRKIIAEEKLSGNALFIHSGGGLGLTGFQEEMAKIIQGTDTQDKNGCCVNAEQSF
jgi:1-aminocyclopropane-1-carboxylate deaminase